MEDVRVTSRDYGNMWTCVHVDRTVKNEKTQKIFFGGLGWGGLNVILWKTLWVGLFYPPQVPLCTEEVALALTRSHCSSLWLFCTLANLVYDKSIETKKSNNKRHNTRTCDSIITTQKWHGSAAFIAKLHFSKPTAPRRTVPRPICRSIFVSSLIATSLLSIAVGDYITQTRCMRTLGDVIGRKASQKTPQMMILSPVIRQLASPVLLTLRKMSLKSNKTSQASKMSLNTSPASKIQKYQKFKNYAQYST